MLEANDRLDLPEPEFVENPENRCPVVLLLDTSASMGGEPIAELNRGLQEFKTSLAQDRLASLRVEVAIVTFGGSVSVVRDFVTVDEFDPPTLEVSGSTPMGAAIQKGMELLEQRKAVYKSNSIQYYRPWLFLITDGHPNDAWEGTAQQLHQAEEDKKLIAFAIGVRQADMNILKRIAPPNRPPVKLQGVQFAELFLWLSTSLQRVSAGKVGEMRALPPISGWSEVET